MSLIKRITHTTEKNGILTEYDVLIYEKNIVWYMAETARNRDTDEFTEDQSFQDYIQNGPPDFAADIPPDRIKEIDSTIKR